MSAQHECRITVIGWEPLGQTMRALGFNFTKNDFRFACVDATANGIQFVEKAKITYPHGMEMPELMEWCETQFGLLITRIAPDQIGHKVSKEISTLDQVRYSCYPQAILNLVAWRKPIPLTAYSVQGINATKFGLDKKVNVFEHVDRILGTHPPHWDRATKEAVLVAWYTLL
jgi:hypothetical protein